MNPQLAWQTKVAETAYSQMYPILTGRRRLRDIQRVVDELHERANAIQTGLLSKHSQNSATSPECAAGCDYCCVIRVHTTVPEAIRIATWLQEAKPRSELEEIVTRLDEFCEQLDQLSPEEYFAARMPCALLSDHRCTIHPVRPMPCRTYLSWSAQACHDHFVLNQPSRIPKMDAMAEAMGPLSTGLSQATETAEAGPAWVSMPHAVRIALVPDALRAWQTGEDLFASCVAPPTPENLTS